MLKTQSPLTLGEDALPVPSDVSSETEMLSRGEPGISESSHSVTVYMKSIYLITGTHINGDNPVIFNYEVDAYPVGYINRY